MLKRCLLTIVACFSTCSAKAAWLVVNDINVQSTNVTTSGTNTQTLNSSGVISTNTSGYTLVAGVDQSVSNSAAVLHAYANATSTVPDSFLSEFLSASITFTVDVDVELRLQSELYLFASRPVQNSQYQTSISVSDGLFQIYNKEVIVQSGSGSFGITPPIMIVLTPGTYTLNAKYEASRTAITTDQYISGKADILARVAPVPEPATLTICAGLGLCGYLGRKRLARRF